MVSKKEIEKFLKYADKVIKGVNEYDHPLYPIKLKTIGLDLKPEHYTIFKDTLDLIKQKDKGIKSLMDSRKKWKDRYYKQKHEIKELKEKNSQLSNYLNDSYYVSADEIREKLNQIHNEFSDILLDKTLSLEEQNLNAHRYDAIRNVLEELLKE